MLRISAFGSGSVAVASSFALHLGVVAGLGGRSHQHDQRAVDVELTSIAETAREPPLEPAGNLPPPAPRVARIVPPLPHHARRGSAPLGPFPSTSALPTFRIPTPSAPAEAKARFVLPSSVIDERATSPAGVASAAGEASDTAFSEAEVGVPAHLIASAPLVYPPRARAAEVEASVALEIVVDTGGRVTGARLLVPAGYGLDEAALAAVRAYRFSPAQRFGKPVRVRMRWSVLFRLR
jgi:TonB family protein